MRKLLSILGLVFSCVLTKAAAVNWTNYVPNIQVATNANVANQLQLGTTFTDGHLWPNAPDGTTPWYLEHTVPHTAGNLFQLVDPLGPYFAITWLWEIQGADLLLTGNAQIQGAGRMNDAVATNSVKAAAYDYQTPATLTPVDAGVSIDLGASTRIASITLTGNVTFATANLVAGKTYQLRVIGCATNSYMTWPAGWHWYPAVVTNALATKWHRFSLYSWGTTDANVEASCAQEQ